MIVTDEKLLRMDCKPVLPEEVGELRDKLEKALQLSSERGRPGIGLACPQIGIAKNMAIVRVTGSNGQQYNIDLVNARIEKGFDKVYFRKEGCLSFPGKFVRTKRFKEILVVDNDAEPRSFVATGLLGVCIQHELDHLDGILLTDLDVDAEKEDELRGQLK
jgi:peptide deformylase